MSDKEHQEYTVFYRVLRAIVAALMAVLFPLRFHDRERADQLNAPYMVIGNHKSFADPLAVAVGIRRDEVHFVGKKELSKYKIFDWFFGKLHAIMIGRGETDMAAMRKCMQTLKDGHVLGIFPEGTRHQKEMMETVETGTALIALRSRVPVLPVYIHDKIRPFRVTHVYFCEPMQLDDLYQEGINSETVQKFCTRIRDLYYAKRDAVNGKK